MSRLNQLFHSAGSRNAERTTPDGDTASSSPAAPPEMPPEGSGEESRAEQPGYDDSPGPDSAPKATLKDTLKTLCDERKAIGDSIGAANPVELLYKLPLIPRLAHNLPDPVKQRVKEAMKKIQDCNSVSVESAAGDCRDKLSSMTDAAAKIVSISRSEPAALQQEPAPPAPPVVTTSIASDSHE